MTERQIRRAVLLMTYGSPSSADDVGRYLAAVRGGRPAEPELVTEFSRRYEVIGGSPLIERTQEQARALEWRLDDGTIARAAMRFSEPTLETVLRELAKAGVARVAAIVLSPQFSPMLMGGYASDIEAARGRVGINAPTVDVAGAWYDEPAFVAAVAGRIREARASVGDAPVLLTAHSLPRRVAEREPAYLDQLRDSADLIVRAAGLREGEWQFCWQSAGHEPGVWMTPDFKDLMPGIAAAGHKAVIVAPIQFLADHLEVLYDVDVGAREQAEAAGLEMHRIRSLNADPGLIDALASVARRTLAVAA